MSALGYAVRHIERFNHALVPLPHATKAPAHAGWNLDANLIRTHAQAEAHWRRHPADGFGVCLEPSELVSIDPDYPDGAREILAAEGVDLDALIETTPTVVGRAPRLQFKAPPVKLSRKAIVWPPKTEGGEAVTVLEFRAGRLQDVAPPSIHPRTQAPYYWRTPPTKGFPELPATLLAPWLDFEAFKLRARNLCPWAPPEEAPPPRPAPRPITGPSVIRAFNEHNDIRALLELHGYVPAGRRRWKSPFGKNMAGVVQMDDGRIYVHHVSDPLGDGKGHDAFDVFAVLEHRGDVRAATREAARLLGLERTR